MLRCPHCGENLFSPQTDGYEDFYTCVMCGREWDKDWNPRRKTVCKFHRDMTLTKKNDCDKMEIDGRI